MKDFWESRGVEVRGFYNDFHPDIKIGKGSILSGWIFIGKNADIGRKCKIANYVEINSGCQIGDGTNIQTHTVLNSGTIVGKDCLLSDHVATADEKYSTPETEKIKRTPCKIGDNVMIGANATLVCCEIGDNSVIGAGSLVLKSISPNQVWGGNPARLLMSRKEYDVKQQKELIQP